MTWRWLDDEVATAPEHFDALSQFIDHSDASSYGNEVNTYFEFPSDIGLSFGATGISVENTIEGYIKRLRDRTNNAGSEWDPKIFYSYGHGHGTTEKTMDVWPHSWGGLAKIRPNRVNAITSDISGSIQHNAYTSGTSLDTTNAIYDGVRLLLAQPSEEQFEDGMESDFSRALIALLWQHGDAAAEAICHLITREIVNPENAAEALRWIGRLEQPQTYRYRRWILEQALNSSAAAVRDGAILGLASMDDIHAKPYLERAIAKEVCSELRDDMLQVIKELGE